MEKYIRYTKNVGETPLEALNRLRMERPELEGVRLAYAGRLDPQAEGELLVLLGEECKNRDFYQGLDKIYTFDVLVGISSDTGDVMGRLGSPDVAVLPRITDLTESDDISEYIQKVSQILPQFEGKITQKYPKYSSKTLNGVPLWKLAKSGELKEEEIPTHEVTIHELEVIGTDNILISDLVAEVVPRIEKAKGNFRQPEIIADWKTLAENSKSPENKDSQYPQTWQVIKFRANVGSGTYIRQLAQDIFAQLGMPALCLHIVREEIILPEESKS